MPHTQANGIGIYYETHGEGEPLVLIAGLGYDLWMWHRMVPGLAERFRVITFDNRGVGQTAKPAGPYTAQMLADDTAGLLDALGIARAAVMGHSMGGFIAQALALSHREKVNKLILSATNFGGPHAVPVTPEALAILTDTSLAPVERVRRGMLVSCAPGYGERNPEMVQAWVDYRMQNPIHPSGYQAQLAIGLGLLSAEAAFESKLKAIQAPTLILFGAHDRVVPPANADLLAREISHSQIAILPDAGHFFPIETPEAANRAIVEFLKLTGRADG